MDLDPRLTTRSFDADDDDDMAQWTGTILGPAGTTFDMRVLELAILCDDTYPTKPPQL